MKGEQFGLSAAVALPLGIAMGSFTPIQSALDPVFAPLRYMPITAFIPLLILWLGGTQLDEDCAEVERTPEDATGSDWACTDLIQDVGPYAIFPLVVTLGLTVLAAVRDAGRDLRSV